MRPRVTNSTTALLDTSTMVRASAGQASKATDLTTRSMKSSRLPRPRASRPACSYLHSLKFNRRRLGHLSPLEFATYPTCRISFVVELSGQSFSARLAIYGPAHIRVNRALSAGFLHNRHVASTFSISATGSDESRPRCLALGRATIMLA